MTSNVNCCNANSRRQVPPPA